jgi:hypothetical protein
LAPDPSPDGRSPDLLPQTEPQKIETGGAWNASPVWMPDGRELLFSMGSMEAPYLARIAVADGKAQEINGVAGLCRDPFARARQ